MTRVNIPELLTRVEQDRDLLNELLSIFIDEFPLKLEDLRDAVVHADLKPAVVASHALKGMLSNLSITQAALHAAQIEQIARSGQTGPLKQAFAIFEQEIQGLLREVHAHLAEAQR